MLKSNTPHLSSRPGWRSDTFTSMRSPASCFVGFRADTSEIGGAFRGWCCSSCKFSGVCHANPTVYHSTFQCFVTHWDSIFECNCVATFRKVVLRDTQGPRSKLWELVISVSAEISMCPLRAKLLCPADQEFYLGHKDRHNLSRINNNIIINIQPPQTAET